MKITQLIGIFLFVLTSSVSSQTLNKLSANQIMVKAYDNAKKNDKKIFLIFEASWCSLCKKLYNKINEKEINEILSQEFIFQYLSVFETRNKNLENSGAEKVLANYNGLESGIPYWLILDENGKVLANSKFGVENEALIGNGINIGFPNSEKEIHSFIYKLKHTTNLNPLQLKKIENYFKV